MKGKADSLPYHSEQIKAEDIRKPKDSHIPKTGIQANITNPPILKVLFPTSQQMFKLKTSYSIYYFCMWRLKFQEGLEKPKNKKKFLLMQETKWKTDYSFLPQKWENNLLHQWNNNDAQYPDSQFILGIWATI